MKRGLFKKAAAVMLSMIMAFGTVSVLPDSAVKDNAITASAYRDLTGLSSYSINGCTFYYKVIEKGGVKSVSVEDVDIENDEFKVEIPSEIDSYTVTDIGWHFLKWNKDVKTMIMPNTIVKTGAEILWESSVEEVVISDNLEELGEAFCYSCPNLKRENVKYNGNKLKVVKPDCFYDCPGMPDAKGVICLKNWLIKYAPDGDITSIKPTNLGNDGVSVDSIADRAINAEKLQRVDLQHIKYIGKDNFANYSQLTQVSNYDEIMALGKNSLQKTPWFETWLDNGKKNGLAKLGKMLYYYKTDSSEIDLTSGDFPGMTYVAAGAFVDCKNLDTIKVNSYCELSAGCFYKAYDKNDRFDLLPSISTYKIKNIYLDGKKLEFSKDYPEMPEWTTRNFGALNQSEWVKNNFEAKTKFLLEQLDMPYYGMDNDMVGTLSKTEEFYNILKVHDYMSTYDYDHKGENYNGADAFFTGGKVGCNGYAEISHYLLECSGVGYLQMRAPHHYWNETKIGDEWFESDFGWDEQNGHHYYRWFCRSGTSFSRDEDSAHNYTHAYTSWHLSTPEYITMPEPAKRFLGDINGNDDRDDEDLQMLWDYIKGDISLDEKGLIAADINFDNVIDITDAVLLENFLHGTAVDPDNFPSDGLAPGFKVVYVNTNDYDYENYEYDLTDRDGYIVLPELNYNIPEGKKFGGWKYSRSGKVGKAGEKVKISEPYTVIQPIWKDEAELDDEDDKKPDNEDGKWLLGDVDGNNNIDIADVSMLINHINGVKSLDDEAMLRADVNKSNSVDISDASTIVNHINGVKALEGKV